MLRQRIFYPGRDDRVHFTEDQLIFFQFTQLIGQHFYIMWGINFFSSLNRFVPSKPS